MSPQKQAAQIANAQKSHGPVTEEGRARSSRNSIRHSLCSKKYLIVPEDRPEFDIYYNDLIESLAPEGAAEALLAEAIIMDEWRLTRARLLENQIFFRAYMTGKPENEFISGAETWLTHSKELATLTLYEQRINRVLTRNKAEFESRQAARHTSGAGLLSCALPATQTEQLEVVPALAEPAESRSETAAPEQPAGFVRSSASSNRGSVHSSPVASPAEPFGSPAEQAGADLQSASTPPAAVRRAA